MLSWYDGFESSISGSVSSVPLLSMQLQLTFALASALQAF